MNWSAKCGKSVVMSMCAGAGMSGSLAPCAHAQSPDIPGWRLVWSEEFTGTSLNMSRWRAENVAWPHNAELEYYLPQQATVHDNVLEIKGERRNFGGRQFVSARIDTSPSFAQQYGRFEARMWVPGGKGYWPAFWLLPATGAWPPEIDIMETIGSRPNTVYMTHHWGTVTNVMSNGITWDGPNFTTGYHRFAVEWSPSKVDWFVDGVLRFTTVNNFPHEQMYIILNLAIGGTLPGNPDANTVFPKSLFVDWVRVYQRDVALANPSFESTSGSLPTGWTFFGNAQLSSTWAHSGSNSIRLFNVAAPGPLFSGVLQNLPAVAGQVWTTSGWFRNSTTTPLSGGNFVDLKIEFYDRNNVQLSTSLVTALNASSTPGAPIQRTVQATAPANTATARLAVVFAQPGSATGEAFFDDLTFDYVTGPTPQVCLADFNGVSGVGVQDIFSFLQAWFGAAPIADFNEVNGVTTQDIFDFLAVWFQGCP